MFTRKLRKALLDDAFCGKALIIVGARQVGKTTLVKDVASHVAQASNTTVYFVNGEDPSDRALITDKGIQFLKQLIGDAKVIMIDEGQKISTIGQTIKLLVDTYKQDIQIYVTGSSTLHLLDATQEPLTGRKFVHALYPLSVEEIFTQKDISTFIKSLPHLLIYGFYPEVVKQESFKKKERILKELTASSLYKDILEFQQIRHPDMLTKLLKALALQIGSLVSHEELSNLLKISQHTVTHYMDLLRKNFIIFTLPPYTTKKRRELSKMHKVYFYDTGIRNAVLGNFAPLENRNDIGALFENFVIAERMKWREYHNKDAYQYFWRTYDGAEVDLIEERNGELHGYECTLKRKRKTPQQWLSYPNSSYTVINRENVAEFLFDGLL